MNNILCYGDSNLRGFIPGTFDEKTDLSARYPKNTRWTGVLQNRLGNKFNVIEEGLNGRTTTLDEIFPGRPYRNGLAQLPLYLESHDPIDLIIFQLGTNDTKLQYKKTAKEITEGMRQLVTTVKASPNITTTSEPKILIIAPQPLIAVANLYHEFDDQSIEKTLALGALYQTMAKEEDCEFLDASSIVTSSLIDGTHLEESQCELLGNVVAKKIIEMSSH